MKTDPNLHRDGTPWFEAPLPRRWHRCKPWTSGQVRSVSPVACYARCACGAKSLTPGIWIYKNSRRKTSGPGRS